jgi:hypothetical protein
MRVRFICPEHAIRERTELPRRQHPLPFPAASARIIYSYGCPNPIRFGEWRISRAAKRNLNTARVPEAHYAVDSRFAVNVVSVVVSRKRLTMFSALPILLP